MKSFISLIFGASAVVARDWTPGQIVKTTSGSVKGQAATRPGFGQVSEYVGIPFAEPPVGPLRWLKAKAFKSSGSVDGTVWKEYVKSFILETETE
jgi:Carboxylesterase family